MPKNTDLDGVRAAALAQIDRSERNYKLAFFGAAILESLFIVGFLLLANLNDRLHVLLLIATVSSYSIVVLGLVALGAHVNRSIGRVLKAIELASHD